MEHQLLVSADNINILGGNINSMKKNSGVLSEAGMETVLKVNTEKANYMAVSLHQNV
jgi:hypothetical protein